MEKNILLFDIDGTLVKTGLSFLRKTAIADAISQLSNNYELGIFSQGFYNIQTLKLRLTNLYSYFSKNLIFISHNKVGLLQSIIDKNSDIIIIDNSKKIQKATKDLNIRFILASNKMTKEELLKEINLSNPL